MSKTWHKIHIALPNQPKDLDRKLRPTSPIVAESREFQVVLDEARSPAIFQIKHASCIRRQETIGPKAKDTWLCYPVT
jgi:hypothetical protein